jgi:hypothetical protein
MADDLAQTLARLILSQDIESATVTVVLKPKPAPPPDTEPVPAFRIGPVSLKE